MNHPTVQRIFTINTGSSSLKVALYEIDPPGDIRPGSGWGSGMYCWAVGITPCATSAAFGAQAAPYSVTLVPLSPTINSTAFIGLPSAVMTYAPSRTVGRLAWAATWKTLRVELIMIPIAKTLRNGFTKAVIGGCARWGRVVEKNCPLPAK